MEISNFFKYLSYSYREIDEFIGDIERENYDFLLKMNRVQIINFVNYILDVKNILPLESIYLFVFHISLKYGLFIEKLPELFFKKEMESEKYDRGESKYFFESVIDGVRSILEIYPDFETLRQFLDKYTNLDDDYEDEIKEFIISLLDEGHIFFEVDVYNAFHGIEIAKNSNLEYFYLCKIENELINYIEDSDDILTEGYEENIHSLSRKIKPYNKKLFEILSSVSKNEPIGNIKEIKNYVSELC